MTTSMRMTKALYDRALDRLQRPHPFAAERVAFAFGRRSAVASGETILLAEIVEVDDDDYEEDHSVGARIGASAIHKALQRALDLKAAAFHVHLHEHRGQPRFSRTDLRELPDLVRPFGILVPEQPYGLILFSENDCLAWVWNRGDARHRLVDDIAIVGRPTTLLRGGLR